MAHLARFGHLLAVPNRELDDYLEVAIKRKGVLIYPALQQKAAL